MLEYELASFRNEDLKLEPYYLSSSDLATGLTINSQWNTDVIMASRYDEPKEMIIKNIKAIRCPCCGAPVSKSINHNCSYCGTFLSLEKEEV